MGTHSCLVERTGGVIRRYERTLDGWKLTNAFMRWASDGCGTMSVMDIGNGGIEYDIEGEGEQVFFLILDHDCKRYLLSCVGGISRDVFEAMVQCAERGWYPIADEEYPEYQLVVDNLHIVLQDPSVEFVDNYRPRSR